jgi:ribose-phosphate pyrophosphokinase
MSVKICSLFSSPMLPLIQEKLGLECCRLLHKTFPDGETYLRIEDKVDGVHMILVDSLENPNAKILPFIFFSETARKLGATKIGLITPYLSYMRQDIAFNPGECITSKYFAELLSRYFDWMVTVDPHLHRYHSLSEIYDLKSTVVSAAESIAAWIKENVSNPVLIGPDSESHQWVEKVAHLASAPYVILKKKRLGDRQVEISLDRYFNFSNNTPVLLDDIISTATTMVETIKHLKVLNVLEPICIGVHAIFSEQAKEMLIEAGAGQVVTCNTIAHESNAIDVSAAIARACMAYIA